MRKQTCLIILILYLLLLISPFLIAYSRGGGDHIFGGFLLNPMDGNTYRAKMYEGWRGEWSFTLPFTAEKGDGSVLFLFYLSLGHLSRITGLSIVLVYHIARIVGAVCLFISLKAFIEWIFEKPVWARRSFLIVLFGSGLGWLMIPFNIVTSDLWVAESYPFLSGFANPHFPLGIAILLKMFMDLAGPGTTRTYFWLAVNSILLSCIMPFGYVIGACVWGIWLLVEWRVEKILKWKHALAAYLPGGFFIAYQYWRTLSDPLLSKWNVQNLTPSPPLWDFLIAFSPALLLAVWGIWRLLHEKGIGKGRRFLIIWFFTGLILMYAPFDLQRRFMFGIFIPVGMLAVEGLMRIPNISARVQTIIFRFFAGISVITNGVVIFVTLFGVLSLSPSYFLDKDEVDGFSYIQANTSENAIVLCSPQIGNFLPGWTGRRVLYGHEFETVNAAENKRMVTHFFSGDATPIAESAFLMQNKIGYIFVGNRERAIGTPRILADLQPVYKNGSVSIYAVR